MRTLEVEENESMRLDKFVAIKCEDLSRTRLQKLILEEKIFVNGKPAKASIKVKNGDRVEIEEIRSKKDTIKTTKYTIRYYL